MTPEEIEKDRDEIRMSRPNHTSSQHHLDRWSATLDEVDKLKREVQGLTFFNEKFGDEIDELQADNALLKNEIETLKYGAAHHGLTGQ